MSHPKLVLSVKFKTALSDEEVMSVVNSRIDDFRALNGLIQKYYLKDVATGEYSGIYFWESAEALDEFKKSELRASIAAAYQTVGEPRVEVFEVVEMLRN